MLKYQITAAGFALVSNALKVGVISDLHTNLAYDGLVSKDDNCVAGGSSADQQAPIGRNGCDPSPTLIDFLF